NSTAKPANASAPKPVSGTSQPPPNPPAAPTTPGCPPPASPQGARHDRVPAGPDAAPRPPRVVAPAEPRQPRPLETHHRSTVQRQPRRTDPQHIKPGRARAPFPGCGHGPTTSKGSVHHAT